MKNILCLLIVLSAFNVAHSQSKLRFTTFENNRVSIKSFYKYSFGAYDSAGHNIVYKLINPPDWIKFDSSKNTITGKPPKLGQYLIHIVATTIDTAVHQQFMLTVYDNKTANILALGNSITNGTDKYNSYRRELWRLLHEGKYNFDMIGSWSAHHMGGAVPNPDFDMDHDGHSGWTAHDILSPPDWDKQRGNINDWLETYTPDIVLLEFGTNEVFQCTSTEDAMKNIAVVIDAIRNKNSAAKIFLAQIPPLGAQWAYKKLCGSKVAYKDALNELNSRIKAFAADKNSNSSPVIIVNQFDGINPATDMYDDIHPNDKGEKIMAEKWFDAIKKHLPKLK